jgi:limonene-1,2-epoxide hydrolase
MSGERGVFAIRGSTAMGTGIERIVLDFVHAAYGERMDVDAMAALMADDFVWQLP